MRNAAYKVDTIATGQSVFVYDQLHFTEADLERAGKILDKIGKLESPAKEQEFVRLVLKQNCNSKRVSH